MSHKLALFLFTGSFWLFPHLLGSIQWSLPRLLSIKLYPCPTLSVRFCFFSSLSLLTTHKALPCWFSAPLTPWWGASSIKAAVWLCSQLRTAWHTVDSRRTFVEWREHVLLWTSSYNHPMISHLSLFLKCLLFIFHLIEWQKNRETETERFHLLVYSPDSLNSQGGPGTWPASQEVLAVSWVGSRVA